MESVFGWGESLNLLAIGLSVLLGAFIAACCAYRTNRRMVQRWLADCASCRLRLASEAAERERTQKVLAERENHLRTIIRSAPVCIKLQALDGTILEMNPAGLAMLDAEAPERVIGKSVYQFISLPFHAAYRELTRRVFCGHEGTLEFEVVSCKKATRRLETHAVPLFGFHGNVTALLGITRDVTEQRRIAEQLRENEARLRAIIEAEPECVKLETRDGVLLDMNPAGLSILEAQDKSQVVGLSVYRFVAPEYHALYRGHAERVFRGEASKLEFQMISLKGERRWLEAHAVPLRDNMGRVTALLGVTRDVTERKQTQEKLMQRQQELAHLCRLTTLGEMASGIAHELNQPLCAISTYADAATRMLKAAGQGSDKVYETLACISAQAERAGMIIRRLKGLVTKKPPQPQPVCINDLISGVIELVQPECTARSVEVRVELAHDLPLVMADPIQIEQVILNLARNAIEAMERVPGPRIMAIRTSTEAGSNVSVEVRDSGPGVPAELVDSIFSPFFTTKANGIGMGLAISRSIVESHNGRIRVKNNAEMGASFYFILPATSAAERDEAVPGIVDRHQQWFEEWRTGRHPLPDKLTVA